jgi:hypothetical protein
MSVHKLPEDLKADCDQLVGDPSATSWLWIALDLRGSLLLRCVRRLERARPASASEDHEPA